MVGRIKNNLAKFSKKERALVRGLIKQIQENNFNNTDLKKLKGKENAFRMRKGKIRIIFVKLSQQKIQLIAIERKSDTTYK